MSALINIYIPKRPETITGKEIRHAASNAVNTALQIGTTAAVSAIRTDIYKTILTPGDVFETREGRLLTEGGLNDNNIVLSTEEGVKIEFINARIGAVKKNTIVSTAIVNRAGRVKERIQADDYDITISGDLFVGEKELPPPFPPYGQNHFPYKKLKELNNILSDAQSLTVASAYLDIFGIDKLVLKSADFNQSAMKHFNVMPFSLKFESDTDYDFLMSG